MRLGVSTKVFLAYAVLLTAFAATSAFSVAYLNSTREHVLAHNRLLDLPSSLGAWSIETPAGLARIAKEITRQATMIAYLNAFGLFTAACALAMPLILLMRGKPPQDMTRGA